MLRNVSRRKNPPKKKQEEEEETPNQPDETHINPAEDARKIDYANAWKQKHDEILHREGYGEPTPGDPEDLSVTEADLDPDFEQAILEEMGPRFTSITGGEFYERGGKGEDQEVYFW